MAAAIPLSQAEVIELATAVTPPADGINSRIIYQDASVKAVLFGFGQGQELSEHTASKPAIMHFLSGEAVVTLDERVLTAVAGTWVHMAPGQPHGIVAKTPVTMLLILLKQE